MKMDTIYYRGEKTLEFFYKLPNGEQCTVLMGPHNREFQIPSDAIIVDPITRKPVFGDGEPLSEDWRNWR